MSIEKETLDCIATKDKRKAAITAIQYSAPNRTMLSTFITTPNHFGYRLMGQISVLESRTYMWTLDEGYRLV